MKIKERFELNEYMVDKLYDMEDPFETEFQRFIFYRTYSRVKKNGDNESWPDVVLRCIEGCMSIRKDWYYKNSIQWDEKFWQEYANDFGMTIFQLKWSPPGRGLWIMGTDFQRERGSMALNNCSATELTTQAFPEDIAWAMDALMLGCGVGAYPIRDDSMRFYNPTGTFDYVIPDTREGMVESVRLKLNAYMRPGQLLPIPKYDQLRDKGVPIKGFGGISSGPEPLVKLHAQIDEQIELYQTRPEYDSVYFKANIMNQVGCMVVSGNVRRSAEILKGLFSDPTFKYLKDYKKFPERESFGYMSNNSVELFSDEDFEQLGEIAKLVIERGEPGYINRRTMKKGRLGKKDKCREDKASLFNP